MGSKNLFKVCFGSIPAPEPDHLWGATFSPDEVREVLILCDDYDVCLSCRIEDVMILCVSKSEIT